MFIIRVFQGVLLSTWDIFLDSAPYLLFGFWIAGLLRYFVPAGHIARYLGGRGYRSVLLASVFGIPLPLCSCGVIPTAIGLHKQGASKGATMAFIVSTPETGVDSISISYALLDPIMTVFRPIAAFITAFVVGTAQNTLDKQGEKACPVTTQPKINGPDLKALSFMQKIKRSVRYALVSLLGDLAPWLIIGMLVAGLISYMIPDRWLQENMGSPWITMPLMLVIGIPLYVCATASTPIAAILISKGMDPGAALVFLLAGPATSVATMTVVATYFGKKTLGIYLLSIGICSLVFGVVLNGIYAGFGLNPAVIIGHAREILPDSIRWFSALILIICIPYAWLNEYRSNHPKSGN